MSTNRKKRRSASLSGGFRSGIDKTWRGMKVDIELKDSWLERMNSIPGIAVVMTCAGHPEIEPNPRRYLRQHVLDYSRPGISFVIEIDARSFAPNRNARGIERDAKLALGDLGIVTADNNDGNGYYDGPEKHVEVFVRPEKTRAQMSDKEFSDWWEAVLIRLESVFHPD